MVVSLHLALLEVSVCPRRQELLLGGVLTQDWHDPRLADIGRAGSEEKPVETMAFRYYAARIGGDTVLTSNEKEDRTKNALHYWNDGDTGSN